MSEKFSIAKLVTGLASGSHWGKTVSFGLSAAFLVFVAIGVYRGYFKKAPPTTSQRAEKITNYYSQPKATFGCATVRDFRKRELPVDNTSRP